MRIGLVIIIITSFLLINTYYDGYYTKFFFINKKYFQMISIGFIGLSLYLLIKKKPKETKDVLLYANKFIKYLPIDKTSKSFIGPILDFTSVTQHSNPQMKRMMNSGLNTTKRSVSETKKKYVASQQNWKCKKCNNQLNATFEVDHIIELSSGGSNHVSNLEALCRECHGKKTISKYVF